MNEATQLHGELTKRFPELDIELDEPLERASSWYLILQRREGLDPIYVEWRAGQGFGVSTPAADDFGTGPDEIYATYADAYRRVVRLVLSEGRTTPPEPVRLADLRRIVGLTQSEVAARAGVKQANVSRAESRDDVLVSTIMSLVAAMGCKMTMNARLPNGTSVRILIGKDASILSPDIQPAKAVGQRKKGRPTQIDHTTRLKSPKRRQHQAPPKKVAE